MAEHGAGGGNVIFRIIRLVLDKQSAKQAHDDAKENLTGIEAALEKLKSVAIAVGAAVAGAFALHKLVELGEEAVHAAVEAEKAWSALANTVHNAGEDFESMGKRLHENAELFAQTTIHGPEEYANALQRLVVLTGDVEASTNNMGLVANVAAAFFKGELEPAAQLVAKAMNGIVIPLQRMGIHAKDAQDALNILNTRSLTAAQKEAGTTAGQMTMLGNAVHEFKEELGRAIIGSDKSASAFGVLREVFEDLKKVVANNADGIKDWSLNVVHFVFDAASTVMDLLRGVADGFGWIDQKMADLATKLAERRMERIRHWKMLGIGDGLPDEVTKQLLKQADELNNGAVQWDIWSKSIENAKKKWDELVESWKKGKGGKVEDVKTPTPETATDFLGAKDLFAQTEKDFQQHWKKMVKITGDGSQEIKNVRTAYRKTEYAEDKVRIEHESQTAAALGDLAGAALSHGLKAAGQAKARQNAIEAIELGLRAGAAAIFGQGALASALGKLALDHAGVSALWATFSGGLGSAESPSSGIGAASTFSNEQASNAKAPGAIVTVYVDGIDPMNPRHQALNQEINKRTRETYGEDSTIRILPRSMSV